MKQSSKTAWLSGVLFTFLIAGLGYLLAMVPGFDRAGQLAAAIVIAVFYRQIFGYPDRLRSGITFSTKRLLRAAIVLYGLKLNIEIVLQDGPGLLIRDAAVIIFAIAVTVWLAKVFKADKAISMLVAVGTGVCGAAAIAAVAPILKVKEKDTAMSVGIIALLGTVFAIIYTLLRPVLPMTDIEYGMWAGLSLHEVAHVALAGEPAGEDGLAMALLAKLGRVFLLIPLCFILMFWMNRKSAQSAEAKVTFPWFLIGFLAMSIAGTYIIGPVIPVSDGVLEFVSGLTTWLLTAAMVGLGLNVSLQDIRSQALRPFLIILGVSVVLSVWTFFVV
ncbi:YeiH family protein [Jeotgalibacillus terrae]|uniref:YeiH family protein n=1 Tax=Jeotgalibacillus terrae TaxID=587735 RepID=A0ABW5ZFS4_9BACL|nr:putative sulfate exporter family transporter [Jeotgalibacillus terrae]MBM7579373.1 putative integral membrane protein (TIGR00698 family) [Jeotgalibacillus terrae]